MLSIQALASNYEFWLSVSLLFGVGINLFGAWNFFRNPQKSARDLGMTWSQPDETSLQPTLTLMRLVGVCLVALAIFYLLTALGPVQQAWNVVAAVLARLSGVVFYGWNLVKFGGPPKFKSYLAINALLALAHGLLLAKCNGAMDSLGNDVENFFWVKFFHTLQ